MKQVTELQAAHNSEPVNFTSSDINLNLFRTFGEVDTREYKSQDSYFEQSSESEYKSEPLTRTDREPPSTWWKRAAFLERDEEIELIRRWQTSGDIAARNRVIEAHLGLCGKLAAKFAPTKLKSSAISFDEGVVIGSEALFKAVDRFDVTRGVRFSTYAKDWIRAALNEFARKARSQEHRPVQDKRDLKSDCCRADTKRVAGLLLCTKCNRSLNEHVPALPLDAVIGELEDGGDATALDFLSEDDDRVHPDFTRAVSAEDDFEIEVEEYRDQLRDALALLDDRERHVVTARFLSDTPVGLQQLSKELGVSSERARQIGAAGLRKIYGAARKADRYRSARIIARVAFDRNYRRTGEPDPTIYGAVLPTAPAQPYHFQWWRKNVQAFTPIIRNLPPAHSAEKPSVRAGQSEGPTAQRLREERAQLTAAIERQRAERMSRDTRAAA